MGPQFEGDVEAHYSDIRKLQILVDKLQRLRQILNLNIRLCHQMKESMEYIHRSPSMTLLIGINKAQTKLNKFLYDQQTSLDRIQTLITRSNGIGQLVSLNARYSESLLTRLEQVLSILEIQATETSKQMNFEMQKLTEQGVTDNKLLHTLTEKSTQDTKTMMIIALISAIFLPATLLAVSIQLPVYVYSKAETLYRHYLDLTFSSTRKMKIS